MNDLFRQLAACCIAEKQRPNFFDDDVVAEVAAGLQQLDLNTQSPRTPSHSTRARNHPASDSPTADVPLRYRIFALDLETTGFNHTYDQIIEIAVVDVASGDSWNRLIRPVPWKKSHKEALAAHGITDDMLRQPGLPTLPIAWQAVHDFITGHTPADTQPVLVAHNGFTFDFKMLCSCLIRCEQQQQQRWRAACNSSHANNSSSSSSSSSVEKDSSSRWCWLPDGVLALDALHIARSLKLKQLAGLDNLKQATLVEHFLGAAPELCHRALADTQQLAQMLPHLLHWAADRIGTGLDERLLPRSLASFAAAAAAKLRNSKVDNASSAAATAAGSSNGDEAAAAAADVSSSRKGGRGRGRAATKVASTAAGSSSSITGSNALVIAAAAVQFNPAEDSSVTGDPPAAAAFSSSGSSNTGRMGRGRGRGSSSRGGRTASIAATAGANSSCRGDGTSSMSRSGSSSVIAAAAAALVDFDDEGHVTVDSITTAAALHAQGYEKEAASVTYIATAHVSSTIAAGASTSASNTAQQPLTQQQQQQHIGGGSSSGAAAILSLPPEALTGHHITLRGRSVPVLAAAAFVQLVDQASTVAAAASSSSSSSRCALLHFGPSSQGKAAAAAAGFRNISWGCEGFPVVFLLEGLTVSKELSLRYSPDGRCISLVTLSLKGANRKQQQQVRQVAAAVDAITALHCSQTAHSQQQQQQQRVYSCLSGASLQVRMPFSNAFFGRGPQLETVILQTSSTMNDSSIIQGVSGSSNSVTQHVVVLQPPSLHSPDAAAAGLQELLPVGCHVSVLLCPSCVWANSKYVGVTLNCLQVLRA